MPPILSPFALPAITLSSLMMTTTTEPLSHQLRPREPPQGRVALEVFASEMMSVTKTASSTKPSCPRIDRVRWDRWAGRERRNSTRTTKPTHSATSQSQPLHIRRGLRSRQSSPKSLLTGSNLSASGFISSPSTWTLRKTPRMSCLSLVDSSSSIPAIPSTPSIQPPSRLTRVPSINLFSMLSRSLSGIYAVARGPPT